MLNADQLEQFHDEGYLAVDGLLDYELEIEPVIHEYETALDGLCQQWVAEGRLGQAFSDLPFEERLVEVYKAGCDYTQPLNISLPRKMVEADTPMHTGPATFAMITSRRLLDAIESIIGSEIYASPIQHARIKPPRHIVAPDENRTRLLATMWHQDMGVTLPEADDTQMVSCWVAITEATVENGCLQMIPHSHKAGLTLHCPDIQLRIPDQLVEQDTAVPVPLKPGGVIFFHPMCQHSSLENRSEAFRWSFDLRFNPVGQPTGRSYFPGFVARSRENPESELRDPQAWARLWDEARQRLSQFDSLDPHRWDGDAPLCA